MPTITQKITPFLWFNGNAEEAVAFYTSVFPNSRTLEVSRYSDAGKEQHGQPPGSVMTIGFELCGQRFTALNGGPGFPFTQAVSFVVHCDTQTEIDTYWEKLTASGGKPIVCGWLQDRFGLSWQIVPAVIWDLIKDPATSGRVMQAVMGMVKLDVAALKAAAEGR
ncbi:MAG: VOC family protein [Phycisphaerales bacterium]